MSDWAEMWQADDEEDRLAGSVMLPPQEEGPNLYDQALAALGQIPGAEGFATVGAMGRGIYDELFGEVPVAADSGEAPEVYPENYMPWGTMAKAAKMAPLAAGMLVGKRARGFPIMLQKEAAALLKRRPDLDPSFFHKRFGVSPVDELTPPGEPAAWLWDLPDEGSSLPQANFQKFSQTGASMPAEEFLNHPRLWDAFKTEGLGKIPVVSENLGYGTRGEFRPNPRDLSRSEIALNPRMLRSPDIMEQVFRHEITHPMAAMHGWDYGSNSIEAMMRKKDLTWAPFEAADALKSWAEHWGLKRWQITPAKIEEFTKIYEADPAKVKYMLDLGNRDYFQLREAAKNYKDSISNMSYDEVHQLYLDSAGENLANANKKKSFEYGFDQGPYDRFESKILTPPKPKGTWPSSADAMSPSERLAGQARAAAEGLTGEVRTQALQRISQQATQELRAAETAMQGREWGQGLIPADKYPEEAAMERGYIDQLLQTNPDYAARKYGWNLP